MPIDTAYYEWCEEVAQVCDKTYGYTPFAWAQEHNDGDEHRIHLLDSIRSALKAGWKKRTSPAVMASWLGDTVFGENPWKEEGHA
jgi:hypothetical protein